jgi:hypothetical protein
MRWSPSPGIQLDAGLSGRNFGSGRCTCWSDGPYSKHHLRRRGALVAERHSKTFSESKRLLVHARLRDALRPFSCRQSRISPCPANLMPWVAQSFLDSSRARMARFGLPASW